MPGAVLAQKPYNEADFRWMRVIETLQKHADRLNSGKGQCLARLQPERPECQALLSWGKKAIPAPSTVRDIACGRDTKLSSVQAVAEALGLRLELVEV